MDFFNKQPRIGILSTSNKGGKVDSAVFGSPRMIDDKTVVMGLGKNRTLSYLQENPHAVFLIVEAGKSLMEWKGVRVYLKAKSIATTGKVLDDLKEQLRKAAGEQAAQMMNAAVTFEIEEIRPIVDFGQGWEKSV
jgi:hypothetical protein